MKFTPFFALITMSLSLSAMNHETNIENLPLIPRESYEEFPGHIPHARSIQQQCLAESSTYQQFLEKITQQPNPHIKSTLLQQVKDETAEWEDAIETVNQPKIQQLFGNLEGKLQQMCHAPSVTIFNKSTEEFLNHWWPKLLFKHQTITWRSFSNDFLDHLRAQLTQGNHTANRELSLNCKKWYLYFDEFKRKAQSRELIQHAKQLSPNAVGLTSGLVGIICAFQNQIPAAIGLMGIDIAANALQAALNKKDAFSAQKASTVRVEIQDMQVRFKDFSEILMRESKKIECTNSLNEAIDKLLIKQLNVPFVTQRLQHWDDLYNKNMIPELERETQGIIQEVEERIAHIQ